MPPVGQGVAVVTGARWGIGTANARRSDDAAPTLVIDGGKLAGTPPFRLQLNRG
jgi:hypothetical protein